MLGIWLVALPWLLGFENIPTLMWLTVIGGVIITVMALMKAKYDQLIAVGKEMKVAITAVMRKLLVLANALMRDRHKWVEKTA